MTTESSQPMTRADFEAQLVAKAWQDENFKQELLSDPKTIFERETGKKAPEGFQVTVVEETPNHIYMVLPMKPAIENSEELSEEALEAVAGGGGYFIKQHDSWVVVWM